LSAIHRDPGHDWTVEELARACSLSRLGVRCAVRRSRREAASHQSRARTPGRRHRPAPRHLPSGQAHRGERRLHVGGGIKLRVQAPLRQATGSLATRHTSETLVSGPRAARSLRSVAEAPVLVWVGW
jgi:hypothetical protein